MDLGQLCLIWCDWFPLSLSTGLPVESDLAARQDWSDAIAPGIWWTFTEHRLAWLLFNQPPDSLWLPASCCLAHTHRRLWKGQDGPTSGSGNISHSCSYVWVTESLNLTPKIRLKSLIMTCSVRACIRSIPVCCWLLVITHYIVCSHLGSFSCSSLLLQTNKLVL